MLIKILMVVGILVLLLAAAQMVMVLFSSFRAPKFVIGFMLILLLSAWGLIHLYAVTFIAPSYGDPPPDPPAATESASPEATETPEDNGGTESPEATQEP